MGIVASLRTAKAFAEASWRQRSARTREGLLRQQSNRLTTFLNGPAADVPAFCSFRGLPLERWPVMDKSALMTDFAAYNRLGLSTDDAWAHFDAGTAPEGYAIGASTGTSGNRGLYIVSEAERYRWLGVMLSRALPDVLTRRHRVAVVLPANSRLYDAANESRSLALRFFDLAKGIDAQFSQLADFMPTVIVAPPKFLRALAESDTMVAPERIFSGAEVLDDEDRAVIEARFSLIVREIYMATEGLFAVGCDAGALHLIEDHLYFEFEPVEGSDRLFSPLVTDFSRTTQIMLRYRMNDILELSEKPCVCGAPHQVIKQVHGRCDDVFKLETAQGNPARFTPDVIRNAVLQSDRCISDFRVIQTSPRDVRVCIPPHTEPAGPAVKASLERLFAASGASPGIELVFIELSTPVNRKLRRVSVAFEPSV